MVFKQYGQCTLDTRSNVVSTEYTHVLHLIFSLPLHRPHLGNTYCVWVYIPDTCVGLTEPKEDVSRYVVDDVKYPHASPEMEEEMLTSNR